MKFPPLFAFILFSVLVLLGSCGKPALLILDPAGAQFFAWQGQTIAVFQAAARKSGYDLKIVTLDQKTTYGDQLDKLLAAGLGDGTQVILAPLLSAETSALKLRYPKMRINNLGAVSINRFSALGELGGKCAYFCIQPGDRKIQLVLGTDAGFREQDLMQFKTAYLAAGGPIERLSITRLTKTPDDAELHLLLSQLRQPVPALTILMAGPSNHRMIELLDNWEGHYLTEGIAGIMDKLPAAVGSIDVDWAEALAILLKPLQEKIPKGRVQAIVDLHLQVKDNYLNK